MAKLPEQRTPAQQQKALAGICSVVRGLLSSAVRDEVTARHRAGAVLRDVKRAPGTFGDRAIEEAAAELGVEARELYRYIAVAEQWSESELRAAFEMTNRFWHPPTWTHFRILSAVPGRQQRDALLEAAVAQSWSTRELDERIRQLNDSASGAPVNGRETVHAALKEGMQTGGRALADLKIFDEALEARIASLNESVDEQLLARTVDTFERIHARVESTLSRLRLASDSQRRIRLPPPGVARDDELDDRTGPLVRGRTRRTK